MTTPEARAGGAPTRRSDPERRDRIIDVCLDVIVEHGVAGASHRRIATAAGVPLGSMTYHFTGMDERLHEAFSRFATTVSDGFEGRLHAATTREEAKTAVVGLITDVLTVRRDLVLTAELYTLAARKPEFRVLTNRWMARSRAALERHFDPLTARLIDALIEGLSLHSGLDTEAHPVSTAVEAIERITRGAD